MPGFEERTYGIASDRYATAQDGAFAGSVPASKLLLFAQKNWGRRNGSSRGTFKFHVTLSSKMLKKFPPPSLSLLELKVVLRNNWSFNSAEFHLEFVINFEHPK